MRLFLNFFCLTALLLSGRTLHVCIHVVGQDGLAWSSLSRPRPVKLQDPWPTVMLPLDPPGSAVSKWEGRAPKCALLELADHANKDKCLAETQSHDCGCPERVQSGSTEACAPCGAILVHISLLATPASPVRTSQDVRGLKRSSGESDGPPGKGTSICRG